MLTSVRVDGPPRLTNRLLSIVDSSAIFASLDPSDLSHERCLAALNQRGRRLVVPALVLCEVLYLVGQRLGSTTEVAFLASLTEVDVQPPIAADWPRIAELVETYREFPLRGVDASVIALAERLDTDTIVTLGRRNFSVVRSRHIPAFRLLPE